jgi:hypothetical protein
MSTAVRDALPPKAVVRVLNPVVRALLCTPLALRIDGLALLTFTGRRSGHRYRVPVGWHEAEGVPVAFTPSVWRVNFTDGSAVTVRHRGRVRQMIGRLVTDPNEVAGALNYVLKHGTSPRRVGLAVATGHTVTSADVASVGRAMVRFVDNDAVMTSTEGSVRSPVER